ncbi:hypothetical protein [Paractinoplanes deccanensis]|uniref:hypothetical protein n=1 Tax=Paractinoplanes deccanensis TaxID=113561 RepID=UPI00194454EC|nr:hypothetical protein [Actinoplanes deccanensis]
MPEKVRKALAQLRRGLLGPDLLRTPASERLLLGRFGHLPAQIVTIGVELLLTRAQLRSTRAAGPEGRRWPTSPPTISRSPSSGRNPPRALVRRSPWWSA